MWSAERWTEHTRRLPPLAVGNHVRIQNQRGPHPMKWDNTGRVVEVCQFDQYVVRVDGSGRMTIQNRKISANLIPYRDHHPTARSQTTSNTDQSTTRQTTQHPLHQMPRSQSLRTLSHRLTQPITQNWI